MLCLHTPYYEENKLRKEFYDFTNTTFLTTPKYNKFYIYKTPTNQHQRFCNAFGYYQMVNARNPAYPKISLCTECTNAWKEIRCKPQDEIESKIWEYLTTPVPIQGFLQTNSSRPVGPSQRSKSIESQTSQKPIEETIIADVNLPPNASAQKKAVETINATNIKLAELQRIYNSTSDPEIWCNLMERITNLKEILCNENNKVKKLKRQASYQRKCREKKTKHLHEHQEVMMYESPGRPTLLVQYPDLHEHIHECIEFGAADKKRRKEVIKVRTIRHLQEELNSKYNEYLSRTTLSNYLLPSRSNSIAARAHHHPANIAIASVSRDEKKEHSDEHYCLASVKGAKQFAALFPTHSVIISQDDKAKVPLGIPAVGRTFKTMQSFRELVRLPDHDFPIGMQQKLIPSVYLLINPSDTNDTFRNGQLSIFVRPQYQIGTSSTSHMSDLNSLVQDSRFDEILKVNEQIKPIWILLVDGGPDENPRHMKNIIQYCRMFHAFDIDYLSVRTHAPGQSAYNPVERSMATLSQKLAGITLPIDKYGSHLNSQGKVVDSELAMKNMRYAGETLCTLWERDPIFGRPVTTQYIDQKSLPFDDIMFPGCDKENTDESVPWQWIENHTKICQYSLDIKKCEDSLCCLPKRCEEAAILLAENNGFLPPVTKGKDGHYLNPLHILEYFNKLKIPGYDTHCPSISSDTYNRLCCPICNAYFPTLSIVSLHKKIQHPKRRGRPAKQKKSFTNSIDDFSVMPVPAEQVFVVIHD
ncbi:uncharacterized protein LOC106141435 [Rhizophagus irregularis DAOM 181602=DAOM 197198]|nr:uncharacterized protein LOC106141435 [Rhizophagus irregularis DAOM 181602=DAOM 197198]